MLVEQFRPGVMERLGLGYEAVRAINPRLVYCSISGYGQDGPRAQEAGHDSITRPSPGCCPCLLGPTGSPSVPPALVADIAGGSFPAVINILLALRQRDLTGEGCHLDIAMSDAMFTFAWFGARGRLRDRALPGIAGEHARRRLAALRALCHRGRQVPCRRGARAEVLGRLLPRHRLARALRDDRDDPGATRAAIIALVRGKTADEWCQILKPLDCCATILSSLEEAVADPQFRDRGLFAVRAVGADGQTMPAVAVPIAPDLRRPRLEPRPVPPIGMEPAVESVTAAVK